MGQNLDLSRALYHYRGVGKQKNNISIRTVLQDEEQGSGFAENVTKELQNKITVCLQQRKLISSLLC